MKPVSDHFSQVAPEYASWRPRYPEALFDYLASLVQRRALAWDCAAGSGQATIPLASRFERVVATDISVAMLGQASPNPRVEYYAATAEASGLPDRTVDLVTVAQGLHWLDVDAFYAEVHRVLAPGGVLAVWTYGLQQLGDPGLDHELGRFYHEVVGPYWLPERRHVETGYRSLPFPFEELDPPGFVMKANWTLAQLAAYLGTWSATQRFRERVGHDPVEPLQAELAAHWGSSPTRLVRWPLSLRVGKAP